MDVERKTVHGDSPVKIDGLNLGFIRILLLRRKGVELRKAKESVGCPGLGKSFALESRQVARGRRHNWRCLRQKFQFLNLWTE